VGIGVVGMRERKITLRGGGGVVPLNFKTKGGFGGDKHKKKKEKGPHSKKKKTPFVTKHPQNIGFGV